MLDFVPDGPDSIDRPTPKQLNLEEAIMRQLDRIAYLRSMGHPWSEALYQLRDMMVGFEDPQFWDGIPPGERKRIESLNDAEAQKRACLAFKEEGWATHSVRAFRGARGPVFRPTAEELSRELRMVMRLLDRQGMIKKTRKESRLPEHLVKGELDSAENN